MGSNGIKFLLDTGVWLRAVNQKDTIPGGILQLLETREMYGLAAISLWEVGKKVQLGKLRLPKDLAGWFSEALAPNIQLLPLTPAIVNEAMHLPDFPNRDPADELIVATARAHKVTLLTTDTKLKNYSHAHVRYFTPILESGPK